MTSVYGAVSSCVLLAMTSGLTARAADPAPAPAPAPVFGATYYVAPAPLGDDRNAGTPEHPFATLERACDAARSTTGARRILVRGGEYYAVNVKLTTPYSDLTIEAAPGEKPVLYGGVPLAGWQKDGDKFYAAKLPEGMTTQPRMLEVDGRMCPRARYPEQGTLPHLNEFKVRWTSASEGGWERKPTEEELTTMKYRPGDLGDWLEVKNAEVNVYHRWDDSCVGVASIDTRTATLKFASRLGYPAGAFEVQKYVVWNIREGMLKPGQWYHDRVQGRIVYWPLPGQDMARAKVIVPTVETVIRMEGTSDQPLRSVTVKGLAIHSTTVPLESGGWAASHYEGAVTLQHVEGCVLEGLEISRVCGQAIKCARQHGKTAPLVTGLRVESCQIGPCGAGGIYACGKQQAIHNNLVQQVGVCYPSAAGIWAGGQGNKITHNEIHDCSYTAIMGDGEDNLFEANLISDCMKTLADGAAIYISGGTRCVLRGNFARDIPDQAQSWAYYLDERCTECVVEKNLALRVNHASLHHMAKGNVLRNNVFVAPAGDLVVGFQRSLDYTMEKNILVAQGTIEFPNIVGVTNWKANLLSSGSGKIVGQTMDMYTVTGEVPGVVGDSTLGDPLLMNVETGDCHFKPGSPALQLGIEPVDVTQAGRVKPGN